MGSRKFWLLRRNAVRNKRKPVSSALLLLQVQSNLLNREKRGSIRVLTSTPSASPFGICFLVECRSSGARSTSTIAGCRSSSTRRSGANFCAAQVDACPRSKRSAAVCAPTTFRGPPLLHKIQHRSTFAPETIHPGCGRGHVTHPGNCIGSLVISTRQIFR